MFRSSSPFQSHIRKTILLQFYKVSIVIYYYYHEHISLSASLIPSFTSYYNNNKLDITVVLFMRVSYIFVCFLIFNKKIVLYFLVVRETEEGTARLLEEIKGNRE